MATVKQTVGARTPRTVSGLSTLGTGLYATSVVIDNTPAQPSDLLVEISATPGTVSGNKQALLFAQASLDGTNFQTGANIVDETDMTFVGSLPLNSNASSQTKIFSLAVAYGGVLPPYVRFVVKNESGSTFSSGSLNTADVLLTVN